MIRRFAFVLTATVLVACGAENGSSNPESNGSAMTKPVAAPEAEKRPLEITQHGATRIDNYAWMKDPEWQQVLRDPATLDADIRAHLEAEGAYYKDQTAALEALRKTLFEEMRGRIKEDDASPPAPDGPYAYYRKFREGGQYPVFVRTPRDGGEETVLYDGDKEEGDSPFFDIAAVNHSPNHALVAYGVDRLGSEYFTIGVRNVETGEDLPDLIESTDGDAVWAADSKSFFYVERDDNQRPKRVKRHILGTPAAEDRLVYEEPDDGFFLGLGKSQSGRYIFIWSGNQVTSETRFIPAAVPEMAPTLIAPREEDVLYYVDHHGEDFLIRTNADDAVDFKIVRAPVAAPGRENWTDLVAHEAGTYISNFVPYQNYFVRSERKDAKPRIVVSGYDGTEHEIDFDAAAFSLGLSSGYEFDTRTVRVAFESPA
ncbi:MAG: S9 family peptidase, partial [Pseudomonadota bacterium]